MSPLDFVDRVSGLSRKLVCISKCEEERSNNLIIDTICSYTENEIFIEGNQVAVVLWLDKDEGHPFFVVQFELPASTKTGSRGQAASTRHSRASNCTSPLRQGKASKEKRFNKTEAALLHLTCQAVQLKLEALLYAQKVRDDH